MPDLKDSQGKGAATTSMYTALIVVAYMVTNSQMLVVNKLCVKYISSPNFVLFAQLAFTAVSIRLLSAVRVVEADALEWKKVNRFVPIVLCFFGTLMSGMKAIQRVPVDTFVCFRASSPLVVSLLEYMFLGRELPSARSCAAMLLIVGGVVWYFLQESSFDVHGYGWLAVWYCCTIAEMVVVKKVITEVKMTTWGRSYYQNLLSTPLCLIIGLVLGEAGALASQDWTVWAVVWLVASCVMGVLMSYMSFKLRDIISATSFSIVGNVCKVGTLAVNFLIWDEHATIAGELGLLVALGGAAIYQQAPLRQQLPKTVPAEV